MGGGGGVQAEAPEPEAGTSLPRFRRSELPIAWVKVPCEQLIGYRCPKKAGCSGRRTAMMG